MPAQIISVSPGHAWVTLDFDDLQMQEHYSASRLIAAPNWRMCSSPVDVDLSGVGPEVEGITGQYFANCQLTPASPAAQDDIAAERLGRKPAPGRVAGGGSAG